MTTLTLARNERIKTTRRPAFWVVALSFAVMLGIMLLERQTGDSRPALGFPDIWAELLDDIGPLAPFFASILVILLVTAEFSYRTARQNVIDGLSKEAWFAGKLLLVPAMVAVFIGLQIGMGGGAASFGGIDGGLARRTDVLIVAGYTLGVIMLTSGAFMTAMLVRGSGAAMAAFFFYVTLLEMLIIMVVARVAPAARPALKFLPFNLFTELIDPAAYDPSITARAAARAAEAGQAFEPEVFMAPATLVTAGALWTLAFIGVAFVVFRKRDL